MGKRKGAVKEYMRLLYNDKHPPLLYGHVAFFRQSAPGQQAFAKSHESSRPFVIGRSVPGVDGLVVYGSVHFLLQQIRRIIDEFLERNRSYERSRKKADGNLDELDFYYDSPVMDFVILVSTHTRNLFHIVNSKEATGKTIPLLSYEKKQEGSIKLNELFDILIHNRYYFFDGGVIRDVFSEKFKSRSRLWGQFMGYGIDWEDYVRGIETALREVRMKHLISLLRGRFKRLSADSTRQDVIFFIQNIRSFSDLLKTRIPTAKDREIEHLMFGDHAEDFVYESPHIQINPDLHRKAFDIRVKHAKASEYGGDRKSLTSPTVTVEHREFFDVAQRLFGDERLLDLRLSDQAVAKKALEVAPDAGRSSSSEPVANGRSAD